MILDYLSGKTNMDVSLAILDTALKDMKIDVEKKMRVLRHTRIVLNEIESFAISPYMFSNRFEYMFNRFRLAQNERTEPYMESVGKCLVEWEKAVANWKGRRGSFENLNEVFRNIIEALDSYIRIIKDEHTVTLDFVRAYGERLNSVF